MQKRYCVFHTIPLAFIRFCLMAARYLAKYKRSSYSIEMVSSDVVIVCSLTVDKLGLSEVEVRIVTLGEDELVSALVVCYLYLVGHADRVMVAVWDVGCSGFLVKTGFVAIRVATGRVGNECIVAVAALEDNLRVGSSCLIKVHVLILSSVEEGDFRCIGTRNGVTICL